MTISTQSKRGESPYSIKDIMLILGISKSKAYDFVNSSPPFRVVRIGTAIRIPKKSFDDWYYNQKD